MWVPLDPSTAREWMRVAMSPSRYLLIATVGSVLIVPAPSAFAHDVYDWINKGGYRSKSGEHCCGKDDCYEVPASRVQQDAQGYSLPDHNLTVPGAQALPSEDGRYWVCKVGARMRCFFAPLNGS